MKNIHNGQCKIVGREGKVKERKYQAMTIDKEVVNERWKRRRNVEIWREIKGKPCWRSHTDRKESEMVENNLWWNKIK